MDQYSIRINNKSSIEATSSDLQEQDIFRLSKNEYHCLSNDESFRGNIISIDPKSHVVELDINGRRYSCKISDAMQLQIQSLNGNNRQRRQYDQLVASMPGMVLSILVEEGQEVSQGDALIILEAMKMENVLKAGVSGTIKTINCTENSPVDKGQLLIELS